MYFKEIILFDGECNLCNGFVNFVIDRDREKRFAFTSLQSKTGVEIVKAAGISPNAMDSIILYSLTDNVYHQRSSAILHIVKHFKGFWFLSKLFFVLPTAFRDHVYDLVAKNRYRWFGKTSCRIPTAELRQRFL